MKMEWYLAPTHSSYAHRSSSRCACPRTKHASEVAYLLLDGTVPLLRIRDLHVRILALNILRALCADGGGQNGSGKLNSGTLLLIELIKVALPANGPPLMSRPSGLKTRLE